MSRRKKVKMARIMVSLPPAMLADFKEKAQESGLSVSRIIYLRWKSRGPMVLVPEEFLRQTQQLVAIYDRISTAGTITADDRQILQSILNFHVRMVNLDAKISIMHGKRGNRHV